MLACAAGKFGERWIELGEAYGAQVLPYEPGWGERLDPAEIDRLLTENGDIEVVFATLSETSTGIVHDVQAIAEVAKRHGAILVVDAVSGLGAAELRQDAWGIDVVVAGSPEGADVPARPGLRLGQPARARLRGARPERPLLLRLGQDREEPAQGRQPVHAGRAACSSGSTSRST